MLNKNEALKWKIIINAKKENKIFDNNTINNILNILDDYESTTDRYRINT